MSELRDFSDFLRAYDSYTNFAFLKINHGFWEGIADAYARVGRPVPAAKRLEADQAARRPFFFEGGFVDELLDLLESAGRADDASLFVGLELSAWPNDETIVGTPLRPERSGPVFQEIARAFRRDVDGLLLKRAVMDGRILELFERVAPGRAILVGPEYIRPLIPAARFTRCDFVAIDPSEARRDRAQTEREIRRLLDAGGGAETCVLLQAGTLAPYWILRLRSSYPAVRWIDGGLAFSIATPEDLLHRPWGKVYRREILSTFAKLTGVRTLPERDLLADIATDIDALEPAAAERVAFVEKKSLECRRIAAFLEPARLRNQWSNRGPAWGVLGRACFRYFGEPAGLTVVPCANGAIALSALAQLHAAKAGRPLRWVVSAFGFPNTVRGVFSGARVVDCDEDGLLSVAALSELAPDEFDGIVVTNVFGLAGDFTRFVRFAEESGKVLLLDNAAGFGRRVPGVRHQAFSLHHTKPFGFGEGGLMLLPEDDVAAALSLLEYAPLPAEMERFWVGNGKISEVSCAALLQRLETSPEWLPFYEMQSMRIDSLALRAGLTPLLPGQNGAVATSLPYLAPRSVPLGALANDAFVVGKYYKPLRPLSVVTKLFDRIVNIPAHPDMRDVDSDVILDVLRSFANGRKPL